MTENKRTESSIQDISKVVKNYISHTNDTATLVTTLTDDWNENWI